MTARLFRDGRPYGPVMPGTYEHLQTIHERGTSWQVLARSYDAEPGDVLVVDEHPYVLLDRCGPGHWAVQQLEEHTRDVYEPEAATEWLDLVEVWSARPYKVVP